MKRHLKINICEMMIINFCDYCFLLAFYMVDKLRYKWTDRSAVELNVDNSNKVRAARDTRIFSSFNQSDHCFFAMSCVDVVFA